jgi:tripartite-type tricarboxylate transporter receptor subunit TctC
MRRRTLLAAVPFALAAPAAAPVARAQQPFPNRPVTVVVPFSAGGPTDVISRLVAEGMGRDLGQPVVVENVTGAGGTIAAGRVAQARPDGHTLLMHHIGHASSATLYRKLPYSVTDGFAPLGLVSDAAMTLVARPDFPAEDIGAAMATLKREGDRLNLATAGLGSAANLCSLLVQQAAGAQATMVVFRGTGPAIAEVMSGRLDLLCDQATNTVPYIRDGRIKVYAVSSARRLRGLPDVPTTAEAGFPSIAMSTWHGMYAPAATPQPIQERLSAALRATLREERLRARFADLLTDVPSEERATMTFHRRFLREEVERWRPIIQAAGAYAD